MLSNNDILNQFLKLLLAMSFSYIFVNFVWRKFWNCALFHLFFTTVNLPPPFQVHSHVSLFQPSTSRGPCSEGSPAPSPSPGTQTLKRYHYHSPLHVTQRRRWRKEVPHRQTEVCTLLRSILACHCVVGGSITSGARAGFRTSLSSSSWYKGGIWPPNSGRPGAGKKVQL